MELSGSWRATIADDEVRRSGVGLEFDDSEWSPITVPGHWRRDDAFAGADGPLLYRHRFHMEAPAEGERRWVTLEGVLYQADVWLDGAYLGDPEGYFFPHTFDITDLSRLADDHVLAVEVTCAKPAEGKGKRSITGVLQNPEHVDPLWNPGGLWRPVRVHSTGAVRIDRLRVLCRDVDDVRAHLRLHARLDADQPRNVLVRTRVDGEVLAEVEHSLARGLNEVDWNIDIEDPQLWWPWTMGEQPLTDIGVEVVVDHAVTDHRVVRTGLREVAMNDWVISVNGEQLFAKGASLLPTAMALAECTPAQVRRDVELAREAGLDLLRVFGHVARPELYDAADQLGMLLWQDFPLQGNYARTIRKEAVRQAREAVDLLGHHPSIALWCAHDEPMVLPPHRAESAGSSTTQQVLTQQLPSWNKTVLDRWVKRAFETADETRTAIAHSGVLPHLPQLDGTDSHLFFGWHHGDERELAGFAATLPRMVRFVGKFGAQAVPASAAFMQPQRWPTLDWPDLVERHGMQLHEFERHVPPTHFSTFEAWQAASQTYQANLLRHQIEVLRRVKYRPAGGFCLFALNDAHPAVSFSLLDHERVPKRSYQAVTEACRPVIIVADRMDDTVQAGDAIALDVHVVSDVRRVLDGADCVATLRWAGGSHSWRWRGDVPPDSCVRIGTIQFVVPDAAGDLWLDLTLEHGDEVATNRYTSKVTGRAAGR